MEEIKEDQVPETVSDDQVEGEQSEETEEKPTLESVAELAKGLQKGYTLTRQELSEIRENLQTIVDSTNRQTGATSGDDEYMTVGKMREILNEQQQRAEAVKHQADSYIESMLTQLKADGVIKTKDDEDALIKYAIAKKEPDLLKAADRWFEIKKKSPKLRSDKKKVLKSAHHQKHLEMNKRE
jgi:hypothetical protein